MSYNSFDIKRLLEALAEKTNKSLVRGHLKAMHDAMERENKKDIFSEDYLYRKLFLRVKDSDSENNKSISLNTQYIERIATFLGFTGYNQFISLQKESLNEILANCIGSWYSYVRCNSGQEYVLISPLTIFSEGREVFMELKGRERKFKGKLKFEGNCIYCLLESNQDKNLHLVFSVGFAKRPNVLQGVFSGMSTAGDPIAGREVLVRQKEEFTKLENDRLPIARLMRSTDEEKRLIGNYFKRRENAILKAGKSSTYELEDLEEN